MNTPYPAATAAVTQTVTQALFLLNAFAPQKRERILAIAESGSLPLADAERAVGDILFGGDDAAGSGPAAKRMRNNAPAAESASCKAAPATAEPVAAAAAAAAGPPITLERLMATSDHRVYATVNMPKNATSLNGNLFRSTGENKGLCVLVNRTSDPAPGERLVKNLPPIEKVVVKADQEVNGTVVYHKTAGFIKNALSLLFDDDTNVAVLYNAISRAAVVLGDRALFFLRNPKTPDAAKGWAELECNVMSPGTEMVTPNSAERIVANGPLQPEWRNICAGGGRPHVFLNHKLPEPARARIAALYPGTMRDYTAGTRLPPDLLATIGILDTTPKPCTTEACLRSFTDSTTSTIDMRPVFTALENQLKPPMAGSDENITFLVWFAGGKLLAAESVHDMKHQGQSEHTGAALRFTLNKFLLQQVAAMVAPDKPCTIRSIPGAGATTVALSYAKIEGFQGMVVLPSVEVVLVRGGAQRPPSGVKNATPKSSAPPAQTKKGRAAVVDESAEEESDQDDLDEEALDEDADNGSVDLDFD